MLPSGADFRPCCVVVHRRILASMLQFRNRSAVIAIIFGALGAVGLPGCAADPPDGPTIANLVDFHIDLSSTPIHVGSNKFVIRDEGGVEHELIGFKIDGPVADLPLTAAGNLDEEQMTNVTDGPNLAPGAADVRTIELATAGTYLLVCNLPGHFKHGMYTVVTLP